MSATATQSITIPAGPADRRDNRSKSAATASSSSSSSSYSSSPMTPQSTQSSPASSAQKQKLFHTRRPSLLSSAILKEECTVINIGEPEGPPRLISYTASSQGFTWNPEIFLPSYVDYDYIPLDQRREPVHEIRLSDEEIKEIYPQ
ncbi:hypothetical protein GGTG_05362 [Gaeumannomyces tritici R3-111a-1]|uniref:Uncharacterized protein n=1 Tax=Gaeumannomyces tritici (strain R3-111a-1) TaxID=644352 RepID=J3NVP9_GAET3|nr:hypothetical protein GGTG_05362 [Gaeumannomyces tritici R3-111a-1]EJT75427.1 hypothetical protein GGTG_05362 [Gaeumannomyces tritici R3-111a-1]